MVYRENYRILAMLFRQPHKKRLSPCLEACIYHSCHQCTLLTESVFPLRIQGDQGIPHIHPHGSKHLQLPYALQQRNLNIEHQKPKFEKSQILRVHRFYYACKGNLLAQQPRVGQPFSSGSPSTQSFSGSQYNGQAAGQYAPSTPTTLS